MDCFGYSTGGVPKSVTIVDWYRYTCLTCCNNIIPTPGYDPYTDPTIDGCSSPAGDDPTGSPPWCGNSSFHVPCDGHDIGYRTCQRSKAQSDDKLRADMHSVCSRLTNNGDACATFIVARHAWAETYYDFVVAFGDAASTGYPYTTNQLDRACVCKDCHYIAP